MPESNRRHRLRTPDPRSNSRHPTSKPQPEVELAATRLRTPNPKSNSPHPTSNPNPKSNSPHPTSKPQPEVESKRPGETSLISSLDWYAKSDGSGRRRTDRSRSTRNPLPHRRHFRRPRSHDPSSRRRSKPSMERAVARTTKSSLPSRKPRGSLRPRPSIEPAPAFADERDAQEAVVRRAGPRAGTVASTDHHDEVEDDLPEAPIAADDDFGAQPWNDLPPEFPNDDSAPSSSPWTDDIPVADLPRHVRTGTRRTRRRPGLKRRPRRRCRTPTKPPRSRGPTHPHRPPRSRLRSTLSPSHDAWTETSAHETWVDAPSAAIAVDTLVEPPSIDTSIPEPPERFSGAPPMPPGMRAPGPTPGVPVTPESFMDPRVSFKRRHPVRRLLLFVLVLGLAAGGGYWWVNHNKPNPTAASAAAFLKGDGTVTQPPGTHFRARFPIPPALRSPIRSDDGRRRWRHGKSEPTRVDLVHTGIGMTVREIDYASRGTGSAGRFAARRGRAPSRRNPGAAR